MAVARSGWRGFGRPLGPIALVGVLGTFLTAAGAALLLHTGFSLDWYSALLIATAVSPRDPAVVFSVLGQREISGSAGTILQGESGANDPVGIALMTSLIAADEVSAHAFGSLLRGDQSHSVKPRRDFSKSHFSQRRQDSPSQATSVWLRRECRQSGAPRNAGASKLGGTVRGSPTQSHVGHRVEDDLRQSINSPQEVANDRC